MHDACPAYEVHVQHARYKSAQLLGASHQLQRLPAQRGTGSCQYLYCTGDVSALGHEPALPMLTLIDVCMDNACPA